MNTSMCNFLKKFSISYSTLQFQIFFDRFINHILSQKPSTKLKNEFALCISFIFNTDGATENKNI